MRPVRRYERLPNSYIDISNVDFCFKRCKVASAHDKTYNKICATSNDSDQSAHPAEPLLIVSAFYNLQAIKIWINENLCHTGWIYRLI